MNSRFFAVLAIMLLQLPLQAQLSVTEKLQLVKSSKHISEPYEIEKELMPLMDKDSVALITFSKSTGAMLSHAQISKKEVLRDLNTTGFKQRYFVLLIDSTAIFYLDN